MQAHPDRVGPRKDDDGEHHHHRRRDERPVRRPLPPLYRRRVALGPRGDSCCCGCFAHAFSLRSRIGRNWSLAFFNSVAGSAPDRVAVSAAPTMSRNSATGTITGRPSLLILAEATTESSHSLVLTPSLTVSSLRIELRNGTPPPACSRRAPMVFDTAHWQ